MSGDLITIPIAKSIELYYSHGHGSQQVDDVRDVVKSSFHQSSSGGCESAPEGAQSSFFDVLSCSGIFCGYESYYVFRYIYVGSEDSSSSLRLLYIPLFYLRIA